MTTTARQAKLSRWSAPANRRAAVFHAAIKRRVLQDNGRQTFYCDPKAWSEALGVRQLSCHEHRGEGFQKQIDIEFYVFAGDCVGWQFGIGIFGAHGAET